MKKKYFPDAILAKIHEERILGIRAGTDSKHRVIGIWAVIVDGRVFVRSWSMKPHSWWRTLLEDPYGEIFVARRKQGVKVRAAQVKSERLKEAVSAAYREKYNTRGSILCGGHVAQSLAGHDDGVDDGLSVHNYCPW
jgi:hypothetical protein